MDREGVFLAADRSGQVSDLEVGLQQCPPRGEVGLAPQQGPELAVEVAGRLQEPVAQVLELVLFEQEILADAGVEGLDRLDGQVVTGLHRGLAAGQFGVGIGQVGLGLRLHGQHRRQARRSRPAAPPPPR